MKKYEIYENNGGGIILVTFDEAGQADYIHSGYEMQLNPGGNPSQLRDDIRAIQDGDDPVTDWEGNDATEYGTAQEQYQYIIDHSQNYDLIADNDGIYPDAMGNAASLLLDK